MMFLAIHFKNGHGGNRTPISWALRFTLKCESGRTSVLTLEPGSLPLAYAPVKNITKN